MTWSDLLEWATKYANIVNLTTTIILAIAAVLAYLVQRARYLREIEPDLELESDKIRVVKMSQTLKEFWSFYIDVVVKNRSNNHAEDLRYEVYLQISPQRGKPIPVSLTDKIPEYNFPGIISPNKILAGRRTVIPIYIGSNFAPHLQQRLNSWEGPLRVWDAGFEAKITISYFSNREPVLFFLFVPRCRVKYTREIFLSWKVETDLDAIPPFASQPWQPLEEEERIREIK